jgi:hypothetical protein
MTTIGYPYNFIQGLSDFWQRFFADSDQLKALYNGSAVLMGQAYLDLLSAMLGISLRDTVALDREFYRLMTLREDEVRFKEGTSPTLDRWEFSLPDPVISFFSIDNRVIEPTASLEEQRDYDVSDVSILFIVDPTDPTGNGVPLNGYARRAVDVAVGGSFTDTLVTAWITGTNVKKGDLVRLLDVAPDTTQRKQSDHAIVVVRDPALFVSEDTPFLVATAGEAYVILRVPPDAEVISESFSPNIINVPVQLVHTRIDAGSVRIFAKGPTGADVVEGTDYVVAYQQGQIIRKTVWQGTGPYGVNYTWLKEVYPTTNVYPVLNLSTTGTSALVTTTRVTQMATWTPDTYVDRLTLSNNFGTLINRQAASSEIYRLFIQGIFQLYILGPVLDRLESAFNVVLGLPVVRSDGETYIAIDATGLTDVIFTQDPATLQTRAYEFPKGTPLRSDLVIGQTLQSFEVLTTAVAITDYVQTPDWWHGATIPIALFTPVNGQVPTLFRRIASPQYVLNVVGAVDNPQVGDPGLIVGADENGFIPPPGQPVFRHRMAFVLIDRYLKYHTFSVKFDAIAVAGTVGAGFAQSIVDLNELVLSSRPAHTYPFTEPSTFFRDEIEVIEDPIDFARQIGSRVHGPDQVLFTDATPLVGGGVWNVGDYFKYEYLSGLIAFPVVAVPVTLTGTPTPPRAGRLVRVYVGGNVGGVALVENVDYSVNYATREVTRLTVWASSSVTVVWTQLNIGNLSDAPIAAADMPLLVNGVDPAHITGAFNPSAAGWDGVITPLTAPRDIGMVERALIVFAHP